MTVRKIGNATIEKVEEICGAGFKPARMFPKFNQEAFDAQKDWMVPDHVEPGSDRLVGSVHTWVVKTGRHTILIDTCLGNHKDRHNPGWNKLNTPFLDRLKACGCKPESVDLVMCTHLHVDHVGWNTRLENGRWVPTFPHARYLVAQREWDYWRTAGPAALVRTGDFITDSVLPIFDSGQAELIGDSHALASDIAIEAAPGHTPGLSMLRLQGGGSEAIVCSDLMHHPLQLRYPDWSTRFCVDPGQAARTRVSFLKEHAGSGRLIFPTHFPSPTGCTIERAGQAYDFTYCGETTPQIGARAEA